MALKEFPWQSRGRNADKSVVFNSESQCLSESHDREELLVDVANRSQSAAVALDDSRRSSANGKASAMIVAATGDVRPSMRAQGKQSVPATREGGKPPLRTVPPWVRSADENDFADSASGCVPDGPEAARVAQHNHSPAAAGKALISPEDYYQHEGYPMSSGERRSQRTSRWITFARASAYPRENFTGEKVDEEWLTQHAGDYSQPWLANRDDEDAEDGSGRYHAFRRKRQVWYKRSQFTVLRNPFIPLVFRMIVLTFAMLALALGGSIWHLSNKKMRMRGFLAESYKPGPSAEMAIIVDVIAIVYISYITYDEYFSKPLGLRAARAKVRLILLDLFFIVFQASNLSLAFESLALDDGACKNDPSFKNKNSFPDICSRAQALASVLLISLVAWLMTFTVSVFRLVERIS